MGWISVEDRLPDKDGRYQVKIYPEDREPYLAVRLFKTGLWFGGLRPFSDNHAIRYWEDNPKPPEE